MRADTERMNENEWKKKKKGTKNMWNKNETNNGETVSNIFLLGFLGISIIIKLMFPNVRLALLRIGSRKVHKKESNNVI